MGFLALLKSHTIFLKLLGATARNASAPAAAASPWSDNSREGNTIPSQSAGAVRGDRHSPLRYQVIRNLLKTYDFNRVVFFTFFVANPACRDPSKAAIVP